MTNTETPTVLNDRYQLGEELGRGGMGTVHRAHDNVLDRDVAVKLLSETGLGTEGRERMLREAQAIAKLNHPNIVEEHDAGEFEGAPFIVMELAEGSSLYETRPFSFEAIVAISQQTCQVLNHTHSHGIVHRGLKPENGPIEPNGTAKLEDFGMLVRSLRE